MATDIKSGDRITANGDYDMQMVPGLLYGLSLVYGAGTGSVTVSQGYETKRGVKYQQETLPNSTSSMVVAATGTRRGFAIAATGRILRLKVEDASSLELFPILVPRVGRSQ